MGCWLVKMGCKLVKLVVQSLCMCNKMDLAISSLFLSFLSHFSRFEFATLKATKTVKRACWLVKMGCKLVKIGLYPCKGGIRPL